MYEKFFPLLKRMNKTTLIISLGVVSVASASAYTIISYFKEKGRPCKCKNRVKNKVIAITGANSGIGYEVALKLAFKGAVIYLCCRSEEKGEKCVLEIRRRTKNKRVYFIALNLCNLDSCNNFVRTLLERESKLDILIHNAGVFHAEPKLTVDNFELHWQTNFLGPVAISERLIPLLFESPSPRIIFVNSEAHKIPSLRELECQNFRNLPTFKKFHNYVHHYGLTKLALKLYSGFLSDSSHSVNFGITSVNPGNVWTSVYRSCWNKWYEWPTKLICALFMRTPSDGAQVIIHAANVGKFKSGSYISDLEETYPFLTPIEKDAAYRLIKRTFQDLEIK